MEGGIDKNNIVDGDDKPKIKKGKIISMAEACNIAVSCSLAAEKRRQEVRDREAKDFEWLDDVN